MKPARKTIPLFAHALCVLLISGCTALADNPAREATKLRMTEGKALFDEKCKSVAGEKIYKTVPGVEGLLLLKIRPRHSQREESDWMWPGAAFAREGTADYYITSFLGYEEAFRSDGTPRPITQMNRGYINTSAKPDPKERPGYRWVEVLDAKDGQRYRYTGSEKIVGKQDTSAYNVRLAISKDPSYDLNVYRWTLNKVLAPDAVPRYGVTFEDHVIPEERRLGLASSTVKVLDLQTGEVLGEMLRYAWSPGAPSPVNPTPWLTAYVCPGYAEAAGSTTRMFVDQVLIPAKEK
ncbi:hypothetical protein [Rhodocyclus tenuis]|uniref:DUF3108 domain-containing protein n=1 Tax=Rhodocyclus tenuis TaxID=1066 RepID=A0A840G771_RHOTE|nr:hypothetical protein [Rhodocyclus tenuis]MBB4248203.1 hypothetical protein [Rhodocyclus tenuis]